MHFVDCISRHEASAALAVSAIPALVTVVAPVAGVGGVFLATSAGLLVRQVRRILLPYRDEHP